jgi:hypothetical protein
VSGKDLDAFGLTKCRKQDPQVVYTVILREILDKEIALLL